MGNSRYPCAESREECAGRADRAARLLVGLVWVGFGVRVAAAAIHACRAHRAARIAGACLRAAGVWADLGGFQRR